MNGLFKVTAKKVFYYWHQLCGNGSRADSLVQESRFWLSGVAVSVVGVFGLLGNLISLVTIATMMKKSLFNKLLLTLTIFDTLFIFNGGIFMAQQSLEFKNKIYNLLFPCIIYPLAGFSMTGSTYTCIAIALERYLGIVHTHSEGLGRRARYYIITILIISVAIDIPRFFEIEAETDKNGDFVAFIYSQLRKNKTYIKAYTLWFRLVATAALPFFLMLFFNLRILIYYRKNSFAIVNAHSNQQTSQSGSASPRPVANDPISDENRSSNNHSQQQQQQHTPNHSSHIANSNISSQERTLYITFFCLTTTFLFCHFPRILINIYEVPMSHDREVCRQLYKRPFYSPRWVLIAACVEKLLLIANSSFNFVIYCLAGKHFRQQMCKLIFRRIAIVCRQISSVASGEDQRAYGLVGDGGEQGTTTAGGTGTATTGVTHDTESSVAGKRISAANTRRIKTTLISQLTVDDERDFDVKEIQEEMRQNVANLSEIVIHEVDEKCCSEKSSRFEPETEHDVVTNVVVVDQCSVDMTVVGHRFNDATCFCVKSHKKKIPKCVSAPNLGLIKLHHIGHDQCTSTSDLHRTPQVLDGDSDENDEDEADTYSCSTVSSRSSRDPRCPRCFIIANTDCSKAVYV